MTKKVRRTHSLLESGVRRFCAFFTVYHLERKIHTVHRLRSPQIKRPAETKVCGGKDLVALLGDPIDTLFECLAEPILCHVQEHGCLVRKMLNSSKLPVNYLHDLFLILDAGGSSRWLAVLEVDGEG